MSGAAHLGNDTDAHLTMWPLCNRHLNHPDAQHQYVNSVKKRTTKEEQAFRIRRGALASYDGTISIVTQLREIWESPLKNIQVPVCVIDPFNGSGDHRKDRLDLLPMAHFTS